MRQAEVLSWLPKVCTEDFRADCSFFGSELLQVELDDGDDKEVAPIGGVEGDFPFLAFSADNAANKDITSYPLMSTYYVLDLLGYFLISLTCRVRRCLMRCFWIGGS